MTLRLNGSTSGYTEIDAPAAAGSNTLYLPTSNGSAGNILGTDGAGNLSWVNGRMVLETSKSATSTAVDFTGIPSWAKRITVILDSVSTLSTGVPALRLGTSSGVENTGYTSTVSNIGPSSVASQASVTSGFELVTTGAAANSYSGICVVANVTGNVWVLSGTAHNGTTSSHVFNGRKALSAILTRIQLTTTAGTDTFDAGTINILYEG